MKFYEWIACESRKTAFNFRSDTDHIRDAVSVSGFYLDYCSLLPWALGRSVHIVLPRGTLFQLGYGTHHWHSNSSTCVCSRRHCLRDCHRTCLSDSSLLFVHFEVSVIIYIYCLLKHNVYTDTQRNGRDFMQQPTYAMAQYCQTLYWSTTYRYQLSSHCTDNYSLIN